MTAQLNVSDWSIFALAGIALFDLSNDRFVATFAVQLANLNGSSES